MSHACLRGMRDRSDRMNLRVRRTLVQAEFTIEADETGVALGAMFLSVPGDVDGDGRVPHSFAPVRMGGLRHHWSVQGLQPEVATLMSKVIG
jgi:hypothetical protein